MTRKVASSPVAVWLIGRSRELSTKLASQMVIRTVESFPSVRLVISEHLAPRVASCEFREFLMRREKEALERS